MNGIIQTPEEGIASSVSGTYVTGCNISVTTSMDEIAKISKSKYFYWVANKKLYQRVPNRKITAFDVQTLD